MNKDSTPMNKDSFAMKECSNTRIKKTKKKKNCFKPIASIIVGVMLVVMIRMIVVGRGQPI
jgi:hypothetical protein